MKSCQSGVSNQLRSWEVDGWIEFESATGDVWRCSYTLTSTFSVSWASMIARKLYAVGIIKRQFLSRNISDILLLHQYVSINNRYLLTESFSCLSVAGTQITCSNEPFRPSEKVLDELYHSQSVYISNTTRAHRESINKLPGNTCCCHRTKAIIKCRDRHGIIFGAVTSHSIAFGTVIGIVSQRHINPFKLFYAKVYLHIYIKYIWFVNE